MLDLPRGTLCEFYKRLLAMPAVHLKLIQCSVSPVIGEKRSAYDVQRHFTSPGWHPAKARAGPVMQGMARALLPSCPC